MAALCRSYTSHAEALDAVNAVLGAGIPGEGVRVLTGEPQRDTREEQMGEFGGPTAPDAPVGEFAGGSHPQGHERGHFAGGEQRGGSFADADREQVVTYPGGVEHARVAGHHKIKKLLTDAGLDEATAERDVNALHAGRVLVLVTAPEGEAERVETLLGG
ncbi:MAG: hypothetical protein ACRDM7_14690 [Thermoleophilaceae bacterium]